METYGVPYEPEAVVQAKQMWITDETSYIEKFKYDFELTNNKEHYVKSSDIEKWVTDQNSAFR